MYTIQNTQWGHVAHLEARIRELRVPMVRDGLILGRNTSIGSFAVQKALHLLVDFPFIHLELDDEVIGGILIRSDILHRIDQPGLVEFVLQRIKPMMSGEEIMELDLNIEIGIAH